MTGIRKLLLLAGALSACTSVKMVQRDGCWVKQTSRTLGGTTEEVGFCGKARPEWAEDRLARLVQECMAQADYRWENRALLAWTRGEPVPPPDTDEQIAKTCMGQAASALGLEAQNDALKSRLVDVSQDRQALRTAAEKDREFLEQSSDKMITALGEAAKKPPPSAVATATSTGTAKTESDLRTAQEPAAPPGRQERAGLRQAGGARPAAGRRDRGPRPAQELTTSPLRDDHRVGQIRWAAVGRGLLDGPDQERHGVGGRDHPGDDQGNRKTPFTQLVHAIDLLSGGD